MHRRIFTLPLPCAVPNSHCGVPMITLPHHCEFLSDAWIDEATGYLHRELSRQGEGLTGQPFASAAASSTHHRT
ncbi:MAG: hypothetical protein R3E84_12000 [Pseudomonadales bacterium]